ncbi:hypothetical protein Tco_1333248, partial [Tanacetum coccineum]
IAWLDCKRHIIKVPVLTVGFEEDWLKLILSRTCIEEPYFTPLFSKLTYAPPKSVDGSLPQDYTFTQGLNLVFQQILLDVNTLDIPICTRRDICACDVQGSVQLEDFAKNGAASGCGYASLDSSPKLAKYRD